MFPFLIFGIILWIVLLQWRSNTKPAAMPEKGEESLSGCARPSVVEENISATHTPHPGKHSPTTAPAPFTHNEDNSPQASSASVGRQVKTVDDEPPQTSSEANVERLSSSLTSRKTSKASVLMSGSGTENRKRIMFVLGASEDNSSDEEPLVTKPPTGASYPQSFTSSAAPQPTSTRMK